MVLGIFGTLQGGSEHAPAAFTFACWRAKNAAARRGAKEAAASAGRGSKDAVAAWAQPVGNREQPLGKVKQPIGNTLIPIVILIVLNIDIDTIFNIIDINSNGNIFHTLTTNRMVKQINEIDISQTGF